eukprot:217406_1
MAEADKKEENEADAEEPRVEVLIQHCGGCGYASKFKVAKTLLEERFPDQLKIIGKKDADETGNFEITVNGTLVHSKTNNGFLSVDNAEQEEVVCKAIAAAINKS